MSDPVRAANALSARWAARCGDDSFVASGAGAWPLLVLLAAGASGRGREELEAAAGTSDPDAAFRLLDLLGGSEAVRAALGLWTRVPVLLPLPPGVHGSLSGDVAADRATLDAWASERTGGRIATMPVAVDASTRLLLASALLVRTAWFEPFAEVPVRWGGREVPGLFRTTGGHDEVRVHDTAAGRLTDVAVYGREGVVVHLVLGEEGLPARVVLPAAIGAVTGGGGRMGAADGPGLAEEESYGRSLRLSLPRFEVSSGHDLTELPDVFGLATVRDTSTGHFPGLSPVPLAVGRARQDAVATFTATGFEAAAVTAVEVLVASAMPLPGRTIVATYDRPFGFVAVHRDSRLVLVAGWVSELP